MTPTYVRRLFDQYAARYDDALTEHLAYRGPALLRDAVEAVARTAGRPFGLARCSISAAAPDLPERRFGHSPTGSSASICRPP